MPAARPAGQRSAVRAVAAAAPPDQLTLWEAGPAAPPEDSRPEPIAAAEPRSRGRTPAVTLACQVDGICRAAAADLRLGAAARNTPDNFSITLARWLEETIGSQVAAVAADPSSHG